jgi:hypothetical protein
MSPSSNNSSNRKPKDKIGVLVSIIFFGSIILIQQIQKNKQNQQKNHCQIKNTTYEEAENRPQTGEINF